MAAKLLYSPNQGATGGTQTAPGGMNYDALKTFLGGSAIKKRQYGTAWSILQPDEASANEQKLAQGRENANQILTQMEDFYFQNKLHKGFPYGFIDEIEAKITPNSSYSIFKKLAKSSRVSLAKAAGDVGNLALQEQMAQEALIPNALYTKENAEEMFKQARLRFGLQPRDYSMFGGME